MRALTLVLPALLVGCPSATGDSDTAPPEPTFDCEPFTRDGPAGSVDGERTTDFISYNLRTPEGYDPTVYHPLIVVYAPAGGDERITEQFTNLTNAALVSGFVIAYADHVSPRSVEAVEPLGRMATEITERWCIDPEQVHLTGHSDGGSAASVIALFDQMGFAPASIAPSAAGISGGLLDTLECPAEPLPVMVLHSRNDGLFPVRDGFGRGAADWWAGCNGCDPEPEFADEHGCRMYTSCEAETVYCEGNGQHGQWPALNPTMIDFFRRH